MERGKTAINRSQGVRRCAQAGKVLLGGGRGVRRDASGETSAYDISRSVRGGGGQTDMPIFRQTRFPNPINPFFQS